MARTTFRSPRDSYNMSANPLRWALSLGMVTTYMGHQDQDGEKVGQMSLFDWKFEAATDREKQKFIYTF